MPHKKNGAEKLKKQKLVPRVPSPGTRGRAPSPSARPRHSGKRPPSPSARARHSGKYLFIFCFFAPIFLWGLPTLFKTLSPNLAYFWICLLYFVIFSFSWIFRKSSNLNYRYMKSYNLAIQKMIFMIFGVYWGLIHQLTWNIEHLVVVTWLTTYGKSVCKLQKIRTKSENHETCRGVVLSHV
jgi:hypothetical protein